MTAFLLAIIMVESGGDVNAVGDGGRSRGPMQISRAYYADACEQLIREKALVPGSYDECVASAEKSRKIFLAYMRRYCPKAYEAQDFETMARIHNGGPRGHKIRATLPYWHRVEAQMSRKESVTQ